MDPQQHRARAGALRRLVDEDGDPVAVVAVGEPLLDGDPGDERRGDERLQCVDRAADDVVGDRREQEEARRPQVGGDPLHRLPLPGDRASHRDGQGGRAGDECEAPDRSTRSPVVSCARHLVDHVVLPVRSRHPLACRTVARRRTAGRTSPRPLSFERAATAQVVDRSRCGRGRPAAGPRSVGPGAVGRVAGERGDGDPRVVGDPGPVVVEHDEVGRRPGDEPAGAWSGRPARPAWRATASAGLTPSPCPSGTPSRVRRPTAAAIDRHGSAGPNGASLLGGDPQAGGRRTRPAGGARGGRPGRSRPGSGRPATRRAPAARRPGVRRRRGRGGGRRARARRARSGPRGRCRRRGRGRAAPR